MIVLIICRIVPIISLVYCLFLLIVTGNDSSLFSVIRSVCAFVIAGSTIKGAKTWKLVPTIIVIAASIAHFVLSILVESNNLSVIACDHCHL